eukprot:gene7487-10202_t
MIDQKNLLQLYLEDNYISNMDKESYVDSSFFDRILPPLWTSIKELNRKNFEVSADGSLIVDVWDYKERMALYKHLIENVHHCEWSSKVITDDKGEPIMQKLNPFSILWGLPLQHGWQFSSGRLETTDNSTLIDPSAWWADMNYYLSVIPYYGAVEAGIAPKVSLKRDINSTLFCAKSSECSDVVKPWTAFFQLVQSTKNSCESLDESKQLTVNNPLADALDFNLTVGMENLLGSLWTAHISSIHYAKPLFEDNLNKLPGPESFFGGSWAEVVDFIAECHFLCDLITTDVLQNLLPPRMLQEGDQ